MKTATTVTGPVATGFQTRTTTTYVVTYRDGSVEVRPTYLWTDDVAKVVAFAPNGACEEVHRPRTGPNRLAAVRAREAERVDAEYAIAREDRDWNEDGCSRWRG